MDPITALGAAAAIAQFSSSALKIIQRIHHYNSAENDLPEDLSSIQRKLVSLHQHASELESFYKAQPTDQGEDALNRLEPVHEHCRSISETLEDLVPSEDDDRIERTKKALKSIRKEGKLQRASKQLTEDVQLLQLELAVISLALWRRPLAFGSPGEKSEVGVSLDGRKRHNIPSRRVSNFIGQKAPLARIKKALEVSTSDTSYLQHVVILCGMGGQGKTQIALEYCFQSLNSRKYSGIFWIDASSAPAARRSLETVAYLVKSDSQVLADQTARVNYVKSALSAWEEPWLMVFDNYDDPSSHDIKQFFPTSSRGRILVTTRSSATSRLGTLVELREMSEPDALELLFGACGAERDEENLAHAKEVVQRLGYLPLAIDQAGAYIEEAGFSDCIGDFLGHYEMHKQEILESTPNVWEYAHHSSMSTEQAEREESVFTTWEMSLKLLKPESEDGAKQVAFLSLLACFHETNISEEYFKTYHERVHHVKAAPCWLDLFTDETTGAWSSVKYARVLSQLKKLSLVSTFRKSAQDGYWEVSLHPLVRDWISIRQCLNKTPAVQVDVTPEAVFSTFTVVLAVSLMPYLHTNADGGNAMSMLAGTHQCVIKLDHRRKCRLLAHILSWNERVWFGKPQDQRLPLTLYYLKDHPQDVQCAEFLFLFLFYESYLFPKAVELAQQVRERAESPDVAMLNAIKLNAGIIQVDTLIELGNPEKAIDVVQDYIRHWEHEAKSSPELEPNLMYARAEMGMILDWSPRRGDVEAARAITEECYEWAQSTGHWAFQNVLAIQLSHILHKYNDGAERERSLELIRPLMNGSDSGEGWGPAKRRANITPWQCSFLTARAFEVTPDGDAFQREMLDVVQELAGDDHPRTAYVMCTMGMVLCAIPNKQDDGITVLQKAVDILRPMDPRPALYIIAIDALAAAYLKNGQDLEGREVAREAVELMRAQPSIVHFRHEGFDVLLELATSYFRTGEDESAMAIFRLRYDRYVGQSGFKPGVSILAEKAQQKLEPGSEDDAAASHSEAARLATLAIRLFQYIVDQTRQGATSFDSNSSASPVRSDDDSLTSVFSSSGRCLWTNIDDWHGYQLVFLMSKALARKSGSNGVKGRTITDLANVARTFEDDGTLSAQTRNAFLSDLASLLPHLSRDIGEKYANWAFTYVDSHMREDEELAGHLRDVAATCKSREIEDGEEKEQEGVGSESSEEGSMGFLSVRSAGDRLKRVVKRSKSPFSKILDHSSSPSAT